MSDQTPTVARVVVAKVVAMGCYLCACLWFAVAMGALTLDVALAVVNRVGLDGFALFAGLVGGIILVVGATLSWYADRREAQLDLQALEDEEWGEQA